MTVSPYPRPKLAFVSRTPFPPLLPSSLRADECGALRGWRQRHLHEGRGHQLRVHGLLCERKGVASERRRF